MSLRIPLAVTLVLAAFAAHAQAPAFEGDAKRGKDLAYTCNGCHAIPNYKNVYPTYSVPKLHGQRPQYLVAALKAYKSGERSHGKMHSQASSLSSVRRFSSAVGVRTASFAPCGRMMRLNARTES